MDDKDKTAAEPWPARHGHEALSSGHMQTEPVDAAAKAMTSETQAFAGSAAGIGSVAFDDPGAYDVSGQTEAALPIHSEDTPMADPKDDTDEIAAEGELTGHYEPDELEATRMRQQGLGMGAKDLQLQRDPTEAYEPQGAGTEAVETEDETPSSPARPDGRH